MRKFWFGIASMAFLLIGVRSLQGIEAPPEVITGYGWTCLLMSVAYGAANVLEHISAVAKLKYGGASEKKEPTS